MTVAPGVVQMRMDPRVAGYLKYLVEEDLALPDAHREAGQDFMEEYRRWESAVPVNGTR